MSEACSVHHCRGDVRSPPPGTLFLRDTWSQDGGPPQALRSRQSAKPLWAGQPERGFGTKHHVQVCRHMTSHCLVISRLVVCVHAFQNALGVMDWNVGRIVRLLFSDWCQQHTSFPEGRISAPECVGVGYVVPDASSFLLEVELKLGLRTLEET